MTLASIGSTPARNRSRSSCSARFLAIQARRGLVVALVREQPLGCDGIEEG